MPKKKNLIIYGDSSFAEMVAHYFDTDSDYCVKAFCVDRAYRTRDEVKGLPVVVLEEINEYFSPDNHYIFAAIGYKSVRTHKALFKKISQLDFKVASYVSSHAMIDPSCRIGINALVLPGAILEPYSTVEENCYVNSGATVCHHAHIKAHTVLAAGSLIGGYTTIGESSLIGFNATVAELLEVSDETLLGAGSVLLQDTEVSTMYVGSPAKAVRSHADTGIVIVPKKLQEQG